jgi:hypothetical protein
MKRLIPIALLSLAGSAALFAQTVATPPAPAPTPANAATYPQYFIGAGAGYTRTAATAAEGTITAAIGLGAGNYSITTVDMFSAYSSVRTGFAKVMAASGNMMLLARVDGGISTTAPIIGNFSGGAVLMYNLGGVKPAFKGTFLYGEVRITGQSTTTAGAPAQVAPGFYFGVGKAF